MSHPRKQYMVVGSYGGIVYMQLIDENGVPRDPAGAVAPIEVVVTRPDGTQETIEAVASLDADGRHPATPDENIDADPETNPDNWTMAGGWLQYIVPQYRVIGDATSGPWMDQAGDWAFQPIYNVASPAESTRAPRLADNMMWVHAA